MRFLSIHVDRFKTEMTERGRSTLAENSEEKVIQTEESLVVLASVEKKDEGDEAGVVTRAALELEKISKQTGVKTLVLHSFAHLFADLARPDAALYVLKSLEANLKEKGFTVHRTPFGWFNTLEMKAKGHPLSRIARVV